MTMRFRPAPGWPVRRDGWTPPIGWRPDPRWPPAPPYWTFWEEPTGGSVALGIAIDIGASLVTWVCCVGFRPLDVMSQFEAMVCLWIMLLGAVLCGVFALATPRWKRTGAGVLVGQPITMVLAYFVMLTWWN